MSNDAPALTENEACPSSPCKRVKFSADTCRPEGKSQTAPKASHRHSAVKRAKRHRRRHPHMVFAIKLTDEGMKSFDEEHFGPAPPGLSGKAYEQWWLTRREALCIIIPRHCMNFFDLPKVNSDSGFAFVYDGEDIEPSVAFVDSTSRTRMIPTPELVAEVGKYIHQDGDQPKWYRLAMLGD
ncbi:hypothetical protein HDZ31DRAFT_80389 [Schizophyllum fasciatum]